MIKNWGKMDDLPVIDIKINIDPNSLKALSELNKEIKELNKSLNELSRAIEPLNALAGRIRDITTALEKLLKIDVKKFANELYNLHTAFSRDVGFETFISNVRTIIKLIDQLRDVFSIWYKEFLAYRDEFMKFNQELKTMVALLNELNKSFDMFGSKTKGHGQYRHLRTAMKISDAVAETVDMVAKPFDMFQKYVEKVHGPLFEKLFKSTSEALSGISSRMAILKQSFDSVATAMHGVARGVSNAVSRFLKLNAAVERTTKSSQKFVDTVSKIAQITLFPFTAPFYLSMKALSKFTGGLEKYILSARYSVHGFPIYFDDKMREQWQQFNKKVFGAPSGKLGAIVGAFQLFHKFSVYSIDFMLRLLGIDLEILNTEVLIAKYRAKGVNLTEEEIKKMRRYFALRAFVMNMLRTWTEHLSRFVHMGRGIGGRIPTVVEKLGTSLFPALRTVEFTRLISYKFGDQVFWLLREFSELGENMTQIIQQFMGAFAFSVQYLRDRIIPRIEFMMRGLPPKLIEIAREYSHVYGLPMEYILRSMEDVYRRTKSIETTEYIFERSWKVMKSTLTATEREMLEIAGKVYKLNEVYQMTFIKSMLQLASEWGGGDPTKAVETLTNSIKSFAQLTAKITMLIVVLFESISPIINAIANLISFYAMLEMKIMAFQSGTKTLDDVRKFVDESITRFLTLVNRIGFSASLFIERALIGLGFELFEAMPKLLGVLLGVIMKFIYGLFDLLTRSLTNIGEVGNIIVTSVKKIVQSIMLNFYQGFALAVATGLEPSKKVEFFVAIKNTIVETFGAFTRSFGNAVYDTMMNVWNQMITTLGTKKFDEVIKGITSTIFMTVKVLWKYLLEIVTMIPTFLLSTLASFIETAITKPETFRQAAINFGKLIIGIFVGFVTGIVAGTIEAIQDFLTGPGKRIFHALSLLGKAINDWVKNLPTYLSNIATSIYSWISGVASAIADFIMNLPSMLVKAIMGFITGKPNVEEEKEKLKRKFEEHGREWSSYASELMPTYVDVGKTEIEKAKAELKKATEEQKGILEMVVDNLQSFKNRLIGWAKSFISDISGINVELDSSKFNQFTENYETIGQFMELLFVKLPKEIENATNVDELIALKTKVDTASYYLTMNASTITKAWNEVTKTITEASKSGVFTTPLTSNEVRAEYYEPLRDEKSFVIELKAQTEYLHNMINDKIKKLSMSTKELSDNLDNASKNMQKLNETLKFTLVGGEVVPIQGNYGTLIPINERAQPVAIYSLFTKATQLVSSYTPFQIATPIIKEYEVKGEKGKTEKIKVLTGYTYKSELWNITTLQRFYSFIEPFTKSFTMFTNLFQGNVDALTKSLLRLERSASILKVLTGASTSYGGIPAIKGFERFKKESEILSNLVERAKQIAHELFVKKLGMFVKKTIRYLDYFIMFAYELDRLTLKASTGYQSYRLTENLLNGLKDFGTFFNYMKNQFGEDLTNALDYVKKNFGIVDIDVFGKIWIATAEQIEEEMKKHFKFDKGWRSYANLVALTTIDWISKFTGYIATQVYSSLRGALSGKYDIRRFGTKIERMEWLNTMVSNLSGLYYKLLFLFVNNIIDEATFRELVAKLNKLMKTYANELKNLIVSSLEDALKDLPNDLKAVFSSIVEKGNLGDVLSVETELSKIMSTPITKGNVIQKAANLVSTIRSLTQLASHISDLLKSGKIDKEQAKGLLDEINGLLNYYVTRLYQLSKKTENVSKAVQRYLIATDQMAERYSSIKVPEVSAKGLFDVVNDVASLVDWFRNNLANILSKFGTGFVNELYDKLTKLDEMARKLHSKLEKLSILKAFDEHIAFVSAVNRALSQSKSYTSKYVKLLESQKYVMYKTIDYYHELERASREVIDLGNVTLSNVDVAFSTITSTLDNIWTELDDLEKYVEKSGIDFGISVTTFEAMKLKVDEIKKHFNALIAPMKFIILRATTMALDELSKLPLPTLMSEALVKARTKFEFYRSMFTEMFNAQFGNVPSLLTFPTDLQTSLSLFSTETISSILANLMMVAPTVGKSLEAKIYNFKATVEPFYKRIFTLINASIIDAVIDVLSKEDMKKYVEKKLNEVTRNVKNSIKDSIKLSLERMEFETYLRTLPHSLTTHTIAISSAIENAYNIPVELGSRLQSTLSEMIQEGLITSEEAKRYIDEYVARYGDLIDALNEASLNLIEKLINSTQTVNELTNMSLQYLGLQTTKTTLSLTTRAPKLKISFMKELSRGGSIKDVQLSIVNEQLSALQNLYKLQVQLLTINEKISALEKKRAELLEKGVSVNSASIKTIDEQLNVLKSMKSMFEKQKEEYISFLKSLKEMESEIGTYQDIVTVFGNANATLNTLKSLATFNGQFSRYVTTELETWRNLMVTSTEGITGALSYLLGLAQGINNLNLPEKDRALMTWWFSRTIGKSGVGDMKVFEKRAKDQLSRHVAILNEPIQKFYEFLYENIMNNTDFVIQYAYKLRLNTEIFVTELKAEYEALKEANLTFKDLNKAVLGLVEKTKKISTFKSAYALQLSNTFPMLFGVEERGGTYESVGPSEMYNRTVLKAIKLNKTLVMTLDQFTEVTDFANRTINGLIDSLGRLSKLDFTGLGSFIDSLMKLSYMAVGLGIMKPETIATLTSGLITPMYDKKHEFIGFQANLGNLIEPVTGFISSAFGQLMTILSNTVLPMFTSLFSMLTETLAPIFSTIVSTLSTVLAPLIGLLTTLMAPIMAIAGPLVLIVGAMVVLVPLVDALAKGFGFVTDGMDKFLGSLMNLLGSLFDLLMSLAKVIIAPLTTVLNALGYILAPFLDFLAQLFELLANIFSGVANFIMQIYTAIEPIFKAIGDVISAFLNLNMAIISIIVNVIMGIVNFLMPVVNVILGVINFIANILSTFFEFIAGIINAIIGFLQAIGLVGGNEGSNETTSEPSVVNVNITMENVQMGSPIEAQEFGESLGFTIKRKWKSF